MDARRAEIKQFIDVASATRDEIVEISRELDGLDADKITAEDLEDLAEDVLETATELLGFVTGKAELKRCAIGLDTGRSRDQLEKVLERQSLSTPKEFSDAILDVRASLGNDVTKAHRELGSKSKKITRLRERIMKRVDCAALLKKAMKKIDAQLEEQKQIVEEEHRARPKAKPEAPRSQQKSNEELVAEEVEAHRELYEAFASKQRKLEREIGRLDTRFDRSQRTEKRAEHRRLEKELKEVEATFKEDEKQLAARYRKKRAKQTARIVLKKGPEQALLELEEQAMEDRKQAEQTFNECQAYRKKLLDIDTPL